MGQTTRYYGSVPKTTWQILQSFWPELAIPKITIPIFGVFCSLPPLAGLQELERSVLLNYPIAFAEISLLRPLGRHLVSIMQGEKDPLQLLFPNGSSDAAEHFYLDSISFQGCNRMVEKAVELISKSLPSGRTAAYPGSWCRHR